ncbi:hypothetical protein [Methylocucumis oryzae]|uniref:hypothetical protein n=1 Tax=Methylocucumis oryzae TaxID=1632867 RepID=UPI001955368B|nr:hypothetical protein [Methylocucumis oryzae]
MVILSVANAQVSEPRYKAVAFDYFVIFDPNSVVPEVEKSFSGQRLGSHESMAHQNFLNTAFCAPLRELTKIFSR